KAHQAEEPAPTKEPGLAEESELAQESDLSAQPPLVQEPGLQRLDLAELTDPTRYTGFAGPLTDRALERR
ncbi:3-carboxy-cis,cis-muconate cycloisomerase, partial [Streptomyces arenae]|nr:3-carboxy-cis,cis-muconate cycloisomerase [Streptomyces arenae]